MSVIYLNTNYTKKGPVLSLAACLLFGGISDIARTPGASRPAVPLHLGMLGRLAMTVTFLGCALPVYLTQTTSQGPHTSTGITHQETVALDHRSLTMSKQMLNPTHHPLLHGEINILKNTSWILRAPRKIGPTQLYQWDLAWKTEEKHHSHLRVKLHRDGNATDTGSLLSGIQVGFYGWCLARHCHDKRWAFGVGNRHQSLNHCHSKL